MKLKVKSLFFDRTAVLNAMDKATLRALSKIGAFLRRRARSSMRRRKKASAPGTPPSVHAGQLKNLLFFSYDPTARTVVVGPEKFARGEAPKLNEFGGTAVRTRRGGGSYLAKYSARPFMAPSLRAEISAGTMPKQWANAVRSS